MNHDGRSSGQTVRPRTKKRPPARRRCAASRAFCSSRPRNERRRRDSNPRDPCGPTGFQDRPIKPLWHSSGFCRLTLVVTSIIVNSGVRLSRAAAAGVHTSRDNRATGGTGVANLIPCMVAFVMVIGSCAAGVLAEEAPRAAVYGIRADVADDQTAAIQKYLNEVERRGGGEARLEPGQYTIRGSLRAPAGVMLAGAWEMPHHGIITKGTVLMAYAGRGKEDGAALIELSPSSGVRGITICYPEQKLADVQPYPWGIHGKGMHNTVENVTLVNAWQGIAIGPESNELHVIRNVFGCVLRRGVYIDNTSDVGRIENVHFNPHYWPRSGHD